MIALLFLVLSTILAITGTVILRTYQPLPGHELRRRAKQGDRVAIAMRRIAERSVNPILIVRLVTGLSATAAIVGASQTWSVIAAASFGFGLITVILVLVSARQAGWLYDKADLRELIERQKIAKHNRIGQQQLDQLLHALEIEAKSVANVMTPRSAVRFVAGDEPVGPILTSELHDSGFSQFPVTGGDEQIIGMLYLQDLVEFKKAGVVKNVMGPDVYYVNQNQKLEHVLSAFARTTHYVFMVVNQAGEIVGLITIEDVLEQLVGHKVVQDFNAHEDRVAVAGLEARKHPVKHSDAKVVE